MRSTVVLALLCEASCSPPYRPFCTAGPERELTTAPGTLGRHTGERVSVVTVRSSPSPDGGSSRTAEVRWFTAEGQASDTFSVGVPVEVGGFGVAPAVARADGVAAAVPKLSADGGSEIIVTLAQRDGGAASIVVDGRPITFLGPRPVLSQVGQTLQLRQGADFLAMAFDGGCSFARRRPVPSNHSATPSSSGPGHAWSTNGSSRSPSLQALS
jgi:hypothetical protein